jgi:uncharacterized membrane protein
MRERTAAATWGKTRIEALSDGVFAIAMTLLVLDLRLPELPRPVSNADAWLAIRTLRPMFFSVVLTFMLSGAFWYLHHATFHSVKYITRGLAFINLFFLMLVSLLPFSASLVGKVGPNHPVGLAVYFTNQLALSVVLNLLWIYASRHHLIEEPIPDPRVKFMIRVQPFAYAAALAAVPLLPAASYWLFLAVMLGGRRITRDRYKALPAGAPAPL